MMKKVVSVVLSMAIAVSLVACSAGVSGSQGSVIGSSETTGGQTVSEDAPYGAYHWNLAMTVSESTTNYKMAKYFADLVREKTDGSIDIELYPGGQLGNTTEQTEACFSGSIEFVTGMTTDLTDFVRQMALFDMPNLFDDINHMRRFLESDYALNQVNQYCEASGIHMLAFSDAGFRELTTNTQTNSVSDLKGQKIRVMTNKYHIAYWNAVGASAVPMQFSELFMGLQQGTVDGQENPYMNIVGNNLQEVQKYVVETNHLGHIIIFFMNDDLYESLPDDTKMLLDDCAAEAAEYAKQIAADSIEQDKQTVENAGCQIVQFSEDDLAVLRDKSQVVYDMVKEDLGEDTVQNFLTAVDAVREK